MDRTALQNLLKKFRDELDLIAAVVVDRNGLIIASEVKDTDEDVDEDIVGALTAQIDTYFDNIKREFGSETGFFHITSAEDKKFAYCAAGNEALLAVIALQDVSDNNLKVYCQHISEKANRILAGEENVSVEIPDILKIVANMREGKLPSGNFGFKLILTGDYQVGKTSLIRRFVDKKFNVNYIATIGVDITKQSVKMSKGCTTNFVIWDVGGQMGQMTAFRRRFYGGTNAIFNVVDLTRPKSLDAVEVWYNDMKKGIPDIKNMPLVIVGNKRDLIDERKVSTEDLKKKAEEFGCHFIETSAKTGENVQDAFNYIAYRILERI